MTQEILEAQIREAITKQSHSTEFFGIPGTGIIQPWTLRAMVEYITPLHEEIARLNSVVLLDKKKVTA